MHFHIRHSKTRGFSLIELLIVIVLIGILTAIAAPSYLEYMRKTNLKDSVTLLKTTFNEAFSKSRSQGHHYLVTGEKDTSYFQIKKCNDATCNTSTELYPSDQTTFPGNSQIISDDFSVLFLAPQGDIDFPENPDAETLEIMLKLNTYQTTLKIYKHSGLVQIANT